MYRHKAAGLLAVGVCVLLVTPAGGSAPVTKRSGCPERFPLGGSEGAAGLTVHRMTCRAARRIVLAFYRVSQAEGPHATVHGLECDAKSGDDWPIVRCRDGRKRLRYEGGFYKMRAPQPKVRVLCWNDGYPTQPPPDILSKPRKCSLFRDGYDYEAAGAAHLRKLRWKHWGDRTTVARGEYAQPMDLDDPWKPITVRLKRPIEECARTVYSKVTFHANGFKSGFPLWTCEFATGCAAKIVPACAPFAAKTER